MQPNYEGRMPASTVSRKAAAALTIALGLAAAAPARAAAADATDANPPAHSQDRVAFHIQSTVVEQANAGFRSPYRGDHSLDPAARGRETADVTFYVGVRPWRGAELWANPEFDQGFGLSNTLGLAGYSSGEAYKVGRATPYLQLHRLFLRQTVALGEETEPLEAGLNQFAAALPKDRIVFTIGKFGVTDIFDVNKYAHDARQDFLNWSVIDAGTFDYAANAWGYTYGAAAEIYWRAWTVRAGLFDLSAVPNSDRLDKTLSQFQAIGELERRFTWRGHDGAIRLTGFLSDGRMGRYADATALAQATGQPADVALVRQFRQRTGVSLNVEQQLTDDLGVFARAGLSDGQTETYEFTDIDRTVELGAALTGARWGRKDDTVGAALVVNQISKPFQQYLNAGGLGVLIGDGQLPHPGTEDVLEAYYSLRLVDHVQVTFDGQVVRNPAYNRDRGPVPLFAVRLHAQY